VQITRNTLDTNTGPSDWFTGTVYIDTIATPAPPSRLGAALVRFTPGARTAWHTHPYGQTIGLCQREGASVEEIRPATACTSSPVRTTGTGRRRTGSWRT
jgi:hypothetical protein